MCERELSAVCRNISHPKALPACHSTQLAASLSMRSGPEYRRWLLTYARKLSADGDKVWTLNGPSTLPPVSSGISHSSVRGAVHHFHKGSEARKRALTGPVWYYQPQTITILLIQRTGWSSSCTSWIPLLLPLPANGRIRRRTRQRTGAISPPPVEEIPPPLSLGLMPTSLPG